MGVSMLPIINNPLQAEDSPLTADFLGRLYAFKNASYAAAAGCGYKRWVDGMASQRDPRNTRHMLQLF